MTDPYGIIDQLSDVNLSDLRQTVQASQALSSNLEFPRDEGLALVGSDPLWAVFLLLSLTPISSCLVAPGLLEPLAPAYAQPGSSIRSESLLVYFNKTLLPSKALCQPPAVAGVELCLSDVCVHTFT